MTDALLAIALLSLISIGYLALPISRMRKAQLNNDELLKNNEQKILLQKQQEFDEDLVADRMAQDEYEQSTQDLTLELASLIERQNQQTKQVGVKLNAVIAVPFIIVVLSMGFYLFQGKMQQLEQWQSAVAQRADLGQKIVMGQGGDVTFEDLRTFYLGLRTKLAEQPDDAIGWLLLGRVAASINDVEAAIKALEQSLKLEPNKRSTRLSYAQTLIATQQDNYLHKAKQVLQGLLRDDGSDVESAMLLGYVENQLGNHKIAKVIMAEVLERLPANDERRGLILQAIPSLANGEQVADNSMESVSSIASKTVTVKLAGLKDKVGQYQWLFVFARPAKKGPPFAVKKIPLASGLPNEVVLSDKDAMIASMNLSSLSTAYISVRFSKDEEVKLDDDEIEFHSSLTTLNSDSNTDIVF
ncbi:c-type cytochrome biogenesis protein CcmI [Saccharobesus litoralis]|uniref:C-type cytochrome biogenesis protein CcmI n=1 Tax=Saccharobesus litoralis TaxID=2172099 RepID=A0A2S0VT71_9ALTE|nr:c-type cytochrome biogenesis protein CcmI [Saccharobesus litoralis]AWB67404.1 c-type cytochrome biogenesis protein CcmI [Saccharobesus litoralis]